MKEFVNVMSYEIVEHLKTNGSCFSFDVTPTSIKFYVADCKRCIEGA